LDATVVQDIRGQSIYDSPFEQEVANAVRSLGYTVHTQVGFSGYRIDLAVVHPKNPERYILAIECDGATYHSSKIARERDFYRQRFLQQRGWKVHRVWSRNWWKAKHKELEKIQEQINLALGRHDVYDLNAFRKEHTSIGI
jgi:very-short-patch-repair endonuclease